MPQKKTLTRTYQARLAENTSPVLIKKTYEIYNKGAGFFMSFLTKLFGGYQADGTPESVITSLPFWLTLQHDNKTSSSYVVDAKVVPILHKKYWEQQTGTPMPETPEIKQFVETIGSQRKNTVWIDQRRRFLDLVNKPLPEEVEEFVTTINSDTDNGQFCRNCITRWWGSGEKSNWKLISDIYSRLHDCVASFSGDTKVENFRQTVSEALNLPLCNAEEFCEKLGLALGKKKGRPDAVLSVLRKLYATTTIIGKETLDNFLLTISKKEKEAQVNNNRKRQAWWGELNGEMEKELNFSFRSSRDNTNEVSAMLSLAIQRYQSWRTWFDNQIQERKNRYETFQKAQEEFDVNSDVDKTIESHRHEGQKFFHLAQFRGIKRFQAIYRDNYQSENALAALTEHCAIANKKGDLGDNEIFLSLAKVLCEKKIHPDVAESSINKFLDFQNTAASYYLLNSPCLRQIDEESCIDPWFGVSKGSFDINLSNKPHSNKFTLELGLFDGEKFVDTNVDVRGKRFTQEIYQATGVKGPRDNAKIRLQKNIADEELVEMFSSENKNKLSCQIKPLDGKWYFNIKTELIPNIPLKTIKDLAQKFSQSGTEFLSVDLGWRDAIAFCHYITDPKGEVLIKSDKGGNTLRLNIKDKGFLREKQKYDYGKKEYCRLKGYQHRKPTDVETELWNKLSVEVDSKWKMRDTQPSVNEDIVKFALKLARRKHPQAQMYVQEVFNHIRCTPFGGLTVRKIIIYMILKDAHASLIKNLERNNMEVPQELIRNREWLLKRMNKIRQERVRITASCIIKKTLEINAPLVVIEKLNSQSKVSNNRKMNYRITNWCAPRIAKLINQAAEEYGFAVKEVYAPYTSLTDFSTNDVKPRFRKSHIDAIKDEDLKKLLSKTISDREYIGSECVKAKIKAHGFKVDVQNLKTVLHKEVVNGFIYLPQVMGPYFHSHLLGWERSDVTAAAYIGYKGLKFFLGWERDKEGFETKKDAKKGSKSSKPKGLKRQLDTDALSRGAKALSEISWGAVDQKEE